MVKKNKKKLKITKKKKVGNKKLSKKLKIKNKPQKYKFQSAGMQSAELNEEECVNNFFFVYGYSLLDISALEFALHDVLLPLLSSKNGVELTNCIEERNRVLFDILNNFEIDGKLR